MHLPKDSAAPDNIKLQRLYITSQQSGYSETRVMLLPKVLQLVLHGCVPISLSTTQRHKGLRSAPFILERGPLIRDGEFSKNSAVIQVEKVTIYAEEEKTLWGVANQVCGDNLNEFEFENRLTFQEKDQDFTFIDWNSKDQEEESLEIIPILVSGNPDNRFDFVYFADGYTKEDRRKFIDDATNLTLSIAINQTFAPVAPLCNFWAAFVPSNERGIGVNGQPKDTWAGLYRPGTELRGVYYAHPERPRAACKKLGFQCDQPILLGNDPLYGGLGGEFTTITSSPFNGPLILRHELGHSVIPVGEEYDGGFAYFGVNSQSNVSIPISWSHWLSDPKKFSNQANRENEKIQSSSPRIERSNVPLQSYPWTLLNTSSPWKTTFQSSGTFDSSLLRFSISGIPDREWFDIQLDGESVEFQLKEGIGKDRWFYDVEFPALTEGEHEISCHLKEPRGEGESQICSVEILEYGKEEEFNKSIGNYGIYPTFSEKNEITFRPTNEFCLMRQVTSPSFCSVCTEGLWLSILSRVSLIESLTYSCDQEAVILDLVEFPKDQNIRYEVRWIFEGLDVIEQNVRFGGKVDRDVGQVRRGEKVGVRVRLKTPDIRKDEEEFSIDEAEIEIPTC